MASPQSTDKDVLVAVYEQYWLHARHQENQRLSFTNIYSVIVAGVLTFLSTTQNPTLYLGILLFLFALSLLGYLLVHSWNIHWMRYSRLTEVIAKRELGLPDHVLRFAPTGPRLGVLVPVRDLFAWFYSLTTASFISGAIGAWFSSFYLPGTGVFVWFVFFVASFSFLVLLNREKLRPQVERIGHEILDSAYPGSQDSDKEAIARRQTTSARQIWDSGRAPLPSPRFNEQGIAGTLREQT
jgi:hypothetical protein